jgi:hypothetical protein
MPVALARPSFAPDQGAGPFFKPKWSAQHELRILRHTTMAEQDSQKPFPELSPGTIWAKVELLGHRIHYGAVREETVYGGTMLRVDVPTIVDGCMTSFETLHYGAAAIYGVRTVTPEQVIEANTPYAERYRKIELLECLTETDDDQ